jgi:hypothetical protein
LAQLFLPPCAGKKLRQEARLEMKKLVRNLLMIAMFGAASVSAFAQKPDQQKRPPKEPVKVVTNDRKDQKPPQNNPPKHDDKKKP